MNDAVNYVDLFGLCGSDITFSSSVFSNSIIGNPFVSNNWIVGNGWATATSGATLNGLTQTTGVPWTTTSWNQSRNPTTLQIGETITWNTSLPFSNLTFSEGSTSTSSPAVTPQTFSQSSSFSSVGMNTGGQSTGASKDATDKKVKPDSTTPDTNRTSKKGVDINLLPKKERIYKNANKVENSLNDDTFIVGGHGTEWSIIGPDGETRINPTELADMIKSDINYHDGMTVVLYSCSTGNENYAGDYTYAQRLANELGSGAKVIAPSDTLWIYSDGTADIYGNKPKTDRKGNIKKDKNGNDIYIIDTTKPGQWNTFIGKE